MGDKPHEWVRWVDGDLDEKTAARFESELTPDERADRERWQKLQPLLVKALVPPPLPYPDFVNARVLEEIARSAPRRQSVRSLVFSGFGALAAASLLTLAFLPEAFRPRSEEEFISQVISARAGNPQVSVSTFRTPDRGVVLWVDGATAIPGDEKVR